MLQNKYSKAIEEYNTVLTNYPQTPIARKAILETGMLYENMGQMDKAIASHQRSYCRQTFRTHIYRPTARERMRRQIPCQIPEPADRRAEIGRASCRERV